MFDDEEQEQSEWMSFAINLMYWLWTVLLGLCVFALGAAWLM